MYYKQQTFLSLPVGNNALSFQERKNLGSDAVVRIAPMIVGDLADVRIITHEVGEMQNIAYEYVDEKGKLIYDTGLENLVEMDYTWGDDQLQTKKIFVIDNHNHAFYCRWKAYLEGKSNRGAYLIHIDQHSDLHELGVYHTLEALHSKSSELELEAETLLEDIATYTNEVLDIASFIKPAKACGLISGYEMVMTEYSLFAIEVGNYTKRSLNIDIDLDFRAPEMGIEEYEKTITRVRQLISLPTVGCVTIATSPTYIDQEKALEILADILRK